MSTSLIWSNLTAYSLQVALLVIVASAVPALVRLRTPGARLFYWHLLLVACLALPLIRPWRRAMVMDDEIQMTSVVTTTGSAQTAMHWPTAIEIGLAVVALGIAARLVWLAVGFWRLGKYRREATLLRLAGPVPLMISTDISGPVTFGFLRPVILLPVRFASLSAAMQSAIVCHELLHVERGDWLFTLMEELVRAVLWFHPAIWWLLGQIQLAREQAVDQRVIERTQARDPYVDALLAMAGAKPHLDLAPAPLFLRKRHLKQRVAGIFRDARMSRKGVAAAFAACMLLMGSASWFVTGAVPLAAAPQIGADSQGVTVELNGGQLLHRAPVAYPPAVRAQGIRGTVTAQLKIGISGEVVDASILNGPEELRRAVLESVLAWHFLKSEAGTVSTVSVTFGAAPAVAPEPARTTVSVAPAGKLAFTPRTVTGIDVQELSDPAREELLSRLPVRVGDQTAANTTAAVLAAVRAYDAHLLTRMIVQSDGSVTIQIAPPHVAAEAVPPTGNPPTMIRIGGTVQSNQLITQVRPVYPPEAKQARVQGKVQLAAIIGPDGQVQDLKVVSGHPLLVPATLDAVKQWVYRPTLLNGNPVTVQTTIDVNFTLAR